MNNKQIIQKLVKYFLENDPEIVAKTLAGLMIDLNRMYTIDKLPEQEKKCLKTRLALNHKELLYFIQHGPRGKMSCHVSDSSEECESIYKKNVN